jgi:UPF0755 protein
MTTLFKALTMHLVRWRAIYGSVLALSLLGLVGIQIFFAPPATFPVGGLVQIPEGASVRSAGEILKEASVIQSVDLFVFLVRTQYGNVVKSGSYLFDHPTPLYEIAYRVTNAVYGRKTLRFVVPEGTNARELGELVEASFPHLDARVMESRARLYEGYLFPDTYEFYTDARYEDILTTMRFQFAEQVASIQSDIDAFGEPLERVVTMASLLEREARQYDTMRTVSGILWKRIELGMPLQVDAVFGYIHNVSTYSPTFDELEIDHPYNTYKYKDLPPGPIGNPGLNALKAAVLPRKTDYLFYLTGRDGNMRYARTFEEHKRNRALYLD